jgi:hypothetical protein
MSWKQHKSKILCYCWYLSCFLFLSLTINAFALYVATSSCLVRLSAQQGSLSGIVCGSLDLVALWITSTALMENPRPLWAFCQPIDAAANFYRMQWNWVVHFSATHVLLNLNPSLSWFRESTNSLYRHQECRQIYPIICVICNMKLPGIFAGELVFLTHVDRIFQTVRVSWPSADVSRPMFLRTC